MDVVIKVPSGDARVAVLGPADRNLKIIREALGVKVTARDGTVRLAGERDAVHAARDVLGRLAQAADTGEAASRQQVLDLVAWATTRSAGSGSQGANGLGGGAGSWSGPGGSWAGGGGGRSRGDGGPSWRGSEPDLADPGEPSEHDLSGPAWAEELSVYASGRPVRARTANQQLYLDSIRDHDLVFGIGPAGTGKTYLAVAAAVHLLKVGRARKVILCRPAVEAGERLGFLPGDLQAKVNPYLRPLLDALHDMMDYATISRFMLSDVVEVVPLAYMRGRTLNRSIIILDEAQNTTRTQMKMFLTRLGEGSKMIVTGDPTQIDLPDPSQSGLIDAARILSRVNGLAWVHFGQEDIVRHNLVQRIVDAYGSASERDARDRAP